MPRKILITCLFCFFAMGVFHLSAQSTLCFTSASDQLIRTGGGTHSVVVRDFNKDGMPDMVVTNASTTVSIVSGHGDRSYSSPEIVAQIDAPWIIESADFNKDGNDDLAVATLTGKLVIIPGNGDGTFDESTSYDDFEPSNMMETVDINNDGNIDIVALQSSSIVALFGDGTAHFGEPIVIKELAGDVRTFICADFTGDHVADVAVLDMGQLYVFSSDGNTGFTGGDVFAVDDELMINADFNDDGKEDILFTSVGKLYPGDGDGNFSTPIDVPKLLVFGVIKAGDFNEDGFIDVASANYYGSVDIMYATGPASFSEHVSIYAGGAPHDIDAVDMDGDEHLDFVITEDNQTGGVYVLYNEEGFSSPLSFDAGDGARAVFANDVNADGRLDLVVSNSDEDKVFTLLQDTDGNFGNVHTSDVNFGEGTIAVGDYNGDGHLDAASNDPASGDISLFYGDGEGTFDEGPVFQYNIGAIIGADFNGDSKPDLAGTLNATNFIAVMIGDGAGNFTKTDIGAGVFASRIYTGDFNGDGTTDIAAAATMDNKISVLTGNGDGTFETATDIAVDLTLPATIYTADLNNDGKTDLVTADAGTSDNKVNVLLNTGSAFETSGSIEVFPGGKSITSGYFDSDEIIDLAISAQGLHNTMIYTGNGDGTFNAPVLFPTGLTEAMISADLDNDGSTDIITSQWTTGNIVVLRNNTARITPAGTITSCDDTIELVASRNGNSYHWTGPEGSAFTSSITVNTRGTYTLVVSNANDLCKTTASITIEGRPAKPETGTISPTCTVATGSILVTKQTSDDLYSFDNGNTFGDDNIKSGLAPGEYSVIIRDADGCNSDVTLTTVEDQPTEPLKPEVTAIDPSCTKNSGSIIVTEQKAGDTYSFDDGETFQGLNVIDDAMIGTYSIVIRRSIDCISESTEVTIEAGPEMPAQPTITPVSVDGMIKLQSSAGNAYEWQQNGLTIVDATAQTYVATESGFYSVIIVSADGCKSAPSLPYNVVISGDIDDLVTGFYPNPADSYIYYTTSDTIVESAIYSMNGKQAGILPMRTSEQLVFDVRDLAPGIYVLKIRSGSSEKSIRWIKR